MSRTLSAGIPVKPVLCCHTGFGVPLIQVTDPSALTVLLEQLLAPPEPPARSDEGSAGGAGFRAMFEHTVFKVAEVAVLAQPPFQVISGMYDLAERPVPLFVVFQ